MPLDETIETCLTMLWSLPDPPATKKSHFHFLGSLPRYDQIDGVAMGSLLGPVLTNIFMSKVEEKWVTNVDSRPSIWYRYVDDTF